MKIVGRLLLACACLAALAITASAASPRGSIETRVLIDGKTTGDWRAVESTLTPTIVESVPALLFRVPVDWRSGEPNYPVGWPRIEFSVPAGQGDWRGWEQVHLRVLPRSSAGSFPFRPLGMTIRSGDKGGWERSIPSLQIGKWQDVTFDLHDLTFPDRVRGAGIFISESDYADGTVLEFAISRLELVRYTAPSLVEFHPISDPAFADAKALSLTVKLAGVPPGKTAPIALRLTKGKQTVATRRAAAPPGESQLSLPLPARVAPGDYTVSAEVGGHTLSSPLRLVTSPWQEAR